MLTRHARKDENSVTNARLALVLDAAAAPAEHGPAPGEGAALAAFRASSVRADGRRSRMHAPLTSLKGLAVAATSAGLLLTGGLAAANAGMLPGAAQDKAHDVLSKLQIDVPGANEHSAGHADTRGRSGEAPPASGEADSDSAGKLPDTSVFGHMIRDLAQSTEGGPGKGKTISEAAKANGEAHQEEHAQDPEQSSGSADRAQAPEARTAPEGQGGQSAGHARVPTPNEGGTTTADRASTQDDGESPSTHGTGTAAEKSGGRSTSGSNHAP